jgi:hypothetical protein
MEFLVLINTLLPAVSKALELTWFSRSKRKEAQREIGDYIDKLKKATANEGKRIQSYLEFDRLITEIEGALDIISRDDKRSTDDDDFWEKAEPWHQRLQKAVSVTLHNFDVSCFEQYHQGLVAGAKPVLEQQIMESNGFFTAHQRDEYISRLYHAQPQIGQMKGFGSLIIEGVGKSLLEFGGQ